MSAVLDDSKIVANQPILLIEGVPVEVVIHFDPETCEKKFQESGDTNADIHTQEGIGVVQGMLVLEYIGAAISQQMNGYVFCGFCEALFQKRPVYLGDTAILQMKRTDNKRQLTRVEVRLFRDESLILENLVLLMDKEVFKRKMKRE